MLTPSRHCLLLSLVFWSLLFSGFAQASSPLFDQWWAKNKDEYATHGIWHDNVDAVLEGSKLRPAELVLRETGRISDEQGYHGSREEKSIDRQKVEVFAREHPLPPVCDGIAYVRMLKEGKQYIVQIKKPNAAKWETLRTYDGEITYHYFHEEKHKYAGNAIKCDKSLIENIRAPDGTIGAAEIPIPYCPYFNQDISNDHRSDFLLTFVVPYPNCYLGINEPLTKGGSELTQTKEFSDTRELYGNFAKGLGVTPETLGFMVDEINGRSADKKLISMMREYSDAFRKFEGSFKANDRLRFLSDPNETGAQKFWDVVRISGFKFDKTSASDKFLQKTISFAYKSTAGYGETVVLVGKELMSKILDPEWLVKVRAKGPSEVQTAFSLEKGFTIVNLRDPDILILGPKAQVEKFKPKYPNIVFKEDLSPEQIKELESKYSPH